MSRWWARRTLAVRVPLVGAAMMVALGLLASQLVLAAIAQVQQDRIHELARLHLAALELALGPHVLRDDVWEVYDLLDRARAQSGRIDLIVVIGGDGRVLASSDPRRAPVGSAGEACLAGALAPDAVAIGESGDRMRVAAPVDYQGRRVGHVVSELDLSDLAAARRRLVMGLVLGVAGATTGLAVIGSAVLRRELRPLQVLSRHLTSAGARPRLIPAGAISPRSAEMAQLVAAYNDLATAVARGAEADRQRAERERLVSLGRLSASLAHEINNPLSGLLNASDTVLRYADRPDVVREAAGLLQRGLLHLRDVSRATLGQHRLDEGEQPLRREDLDDLRVLLTPALRPRRQNLTWHIEGADGLHAPSGPLRQVLLNLLLNAAAAAPVGGSVGLSLTNPEGVARFVVSDDGPGMPVETAGWLSKGAAGTAIASPSRGVGLRLVKNLVDQLGGRITVFRRDGRTEVSLEIPEPRA